MKFKYYVCVFTLNRQLQEKLIDEAHKLGYTNCMVNTEGEEYWTKFYRIGNITTFTQQMKELENYYYFNLDTNPELFEAVLGIIAIREDEEFHKGEYAFWEGSQPAFGKILKRNEYEDCWALNIDGNLNSHDSCNEKYLRKAIPEEIIAHFSKQNKTEKVEEFVLPQNYWIKVENLTEWKEVWNYIKINDKDHDVSLHENAKPYVYPYYGGVRHNSFTYNNTPTYDLEVFSFKQFKQHLLNKPNMEKKIIGYKLIKPEYLQAALKITKLSRDIQEHLEQMIRENLPDSSTVDKLREAGVLDLWFEPVYKEDKKLPAINSHSGKLEGDYIIYGSNCARFNKEFFKKLTHMNPANTSGNRKIQSIKLDSGVEITMEQVKEIVEFIEENEKSC